MLQLKNATPFAADIAVFPNEKGIDTLFTMVKASFVLGNSWMLIDEQPSPQAEDEYWGEPGKSSIKYASDFHTGKPTTDIVVVGEACAPQGQAVKQLLVDVSVGKVQKKALVIGDRFWDGGRATPPQAFTSMPIVYEKAFGGRHDINEHEYLAEERNPVGCGFLGKRSNEEMNGTQLPNIEDPLNPIQSRSDTPKPVGFGFCSPDWLPRRKFAGTYDENWKKNIAPYLPLDFDSRFFNAAQPGLIYPEYLNGGESVIIKNMHLDGTLQFSVPEVKILCNVLLNNKNHTPKLNLESLILEPNKRQLSMVWKAAVACNKLTVNEVELKLLR